MRHLLHLVNHLRADVFGVAMTEFALALPLLLTAGLYGAETANLALVHMKISQLGIHLADNASRIGDTSQITNRAIYEADIDDLIVGSNIQAGPSIDFYNHGRAIVSSLEVFDPAVSCGSGACPSPPQAAGAQFIHWQRCMGKKAYASSYGVQGQTMPAGIGPSGEEVTAEPGSAVIFVEVAYDYQPLVSNRFFGPTTVTATSSFIVRSNIDLSGLKQRNPSSPAPVADCSAFSAPPA